MPVLDRGYRVQDISEPEKNFYSPISPDMTYWILFTLSLHKKMEKMLNALKDDYPTMEFSQTGFIKDTIQNCYGLFGQKERGQVCQHL